MKAEQWLFEETGIKTPHGKSSYRRLGFNFVSYDGTSSEYLEPVSDTRMTSDRETTQGSSDLNANATISFQIIRKGLAEEFFAVNDFGTI
jgi:hypothetical protein